MIERRPVTRAPPSDVDLKFIRAWNLREIFYVENYYPARLTVISAPAGAVNVIIVPSSVAVTVSYT